MLVYFRGQESYVRGAGGGPMFISAKLISFFLIRPGSRVHMLASTVSSKFLQRMAIVEGFHFEVGRCKLHQMHSFFFNIHDIVYMYVNLLKMSHCPTYFQRVCMLFSCVRKLLLGSSGWRTQPTTTSNWATKSCSPLRRPSATCVAVPYSTKMGYQPLP